MSTALITGSAGFIGSHIVDKLINDGHTVIGIDNFTTGKWENVNKKCTTFNLDIRDRISIDNLFDQYKFDYVFHLAAQIDLRRSIKEPAFDATNNIIGSLNIIENATKHKAKVIFSSTGGALYSEEAFLPFTEDSLIKPASPYGIAKRTVETYLEFFKNQYGLDYTVLRYSNVYGPRQAGAECGVIAIFMNKLIKGEPITVFGDGNSTRDYVFVQDVVSANMLAMNISGTYNVSTGVGTSVNQIVDLLKPYYKDCQVTHSDPVAGEMRHSVLCADRLKAKGWSSKYSLDEGVDEIMLNRLGVSLNNYMK